MSETWFLCRRCGKELFFAFEHDCAPSPTEKPDEAQTPIADELCGMSRLYPRDARFAKSILEVAKLERELAAMTKLNRYHVAELNRIATLSTSTKEKP